MNSIAFDTEKALDDEPSRDKAESTRRKTMLLRLHEHYTYNTYVAQEERVASFIICGFKDSPLFPSFRKYFTYANQVEPRVRDVIRVRRPPRFRERSSVKNRTLVGQKL